MNVKVSMRSTLTIFELDILSVTNSKVRNSEQYIAQKSHARQMLGDIRQGRLHVVHVKST